MTLVAQTGDLPTKRSRAKQLGSARYLTGKPCKRGHIADRYTSNGWCAKCAAIDQVGSKAIYYLKNEGEIKRKQRIYTANNPGYMPIWRACNKDLVDAHNWKRRALKVSAEGSHSAEDIVALRSRQKDKCVYCKIRLKGKGHIDHIIALSNGGSDWPSNLQLLCAPCNLAKHNKHPIVFAQQKGLLL